MGFLQRIIFMVATLALVACNNSISSQGRDEKEPEKQTEQAKSLIETVEALSISDFGKDEKLIISILRDTGEYDTFLLDSNSDVIECANEFCSVIRSSMAAHYSAVVQTGAHSDVLTLTAKSGDYKGESLRIHLFTLDDGAYWQSGTYTAQSNKDGHVKELADHYTNTWGAVSWVMDFAYLEGTSHAVAILEDERKWNDPMKPADAYESSSLLTMGSNAKALSSSILSSFKVGSGVIDGSIIGSAQGEVLFKLGATPDAVEEVRLRYFGKESADATFTVVYELK